MLCLTCKVRLLSLELTEETGSLVLGGIGELQLIGRRERIAQSVFRREWVSEAVVQRGLRASHLINKLSCLHDLKRVRRQPNSYRSLEHVAQFGVVERARTIRLE